MTIQQLKETVSQMIPWLSERDIDEVLSTSLKVIAAALSREERVTLPKVGTLEVRSYPPRRGSVTQETRIRTSFRLNRALKRFVKRKVVDETAPYRTKALTPGRGKSSVSKTAFLPTGRIN